MVPLVANPVYGWGIHTTLYKFQLFRFRFLYKSTLETFAGAFLLFNVWLYVVLSILVSVVNWKMESQTSEALGRVEGTERVKLTEPETSSHFWLDLWWIKEAETFCRETKLSRTGRSPLTNLPSIFSHHYIELKTKHNKFFQINLSFPWSLRDFLLLVFLTGLR